MILAKNEILFKYNIYFLVIAVFCSRKPFVMRIYSKYYEICFFYTNKTHPNLSSFRSTYHICLNNCNKTYTSNCDIIFVIPLRLYIISCPNQKHTKNGCGPFIFASIYTRIRIATDSISIYMHSQFSPIMLRSSRLNGSDQLKYSTINFTYVYLCD